MRDWISAPIAEAEPCGPDLERADDDAFLDYYYEAESRLPERYFTPGMAGVGRDGREGAEDRLFDPDSIDLPREVAVITGLLQRSRDLRLLSLLARFQILAGQLADFADSVGAMADLLEAWPDRANPDLSEGSSERRNALDSLAVQATVVAPLQHLPLIAEAGFSLRSHQVATGQATQRQSEDMQDAGAILSSLRHPRHAAEIAATHDLLTRISQDLERIRKLAATEAAGGLAVDFSAPLDVIAEIQALIMQARPDLQPGAGAETVPDPAPEAFSNPAPPAMPAPALPAHTAASMIADRREAEARLKAAESWLAEAEPSSPALLLIVQARQLIGKTLVEALEALMPQDAARAVIAFAPDTGFALPMERLRQLAAIAGQSTESNEGSDPNIDLHEIATPPIRDRADLSGELGLIENWFLNHEPASPIPILLSRSRGFLNRGFEAILSELIPPRV